MVYLGYHTYVKLTIQEDSPCKAYLSLRRISLNLPTPRPLAIRYMLYETFLCIVCRFGFVLSANKLPFTQTAALKRLLREAFLDLTRVKERLDKLEFHTGLRKSRAQSSLGEGAAKTRLKGEVCAGGAFLLLDDQSSRYSRAALEQAGLHSGIDVRFTFETSYRERDVMITECSAGHSGSDGSILGGPISVTKLVYNAQVTDDLNVVVAPLGSLASDITETVNPLQVSIVLT